MTTETYILSLKRVELAIADLEMFDVGGVLDLITEYIWQNSEDKETNANQAYYDNF